MTDTALSRSMSCTVDPSLLALPDRIAELLIELGSPPRPAAHLRAVHDVAHQLVDWMGKHYSTVLFDREAVLFGAATHDIGKTVHVSELSGPGAAHEQAGQALLLGRGVSPELARSRHPSRSTTERRRRDTVTMSPIGPGHTPTIPPRPTLPDLAAARELGPAETVEARWRQWRGWEVRHGTVRATLSLVGAEEGRRRAGQSVMTRAQAR